MNPRRFVFFALLGLVGCSTAPVPEQQANQGYIETANHSSGLQERGLGQQTDLQKRANAEAWRLFPDLRAKWDALRKDAIKHEVIYPRLVSVKRPFYPKNALRHKQTGVVYLGFQLGTDGIPRDIRVLFDAAKPMADAAQKAFQEWRYKPALVDGVPTEIAAAIPIVFELQ